MIKYFYCWGGKFEIYVSFWRISLGVNQLNYKIFGQCVVILNILFVKKNYKKKSFYLDANNTKFFFFVPNYIFILHAIY